MKAFDFASATTAQQARELMRRTGRAQPVSAEEALAAYANPRNWKQIEGRGEDGGPRCYWAWVGPVIVGYELAQLGLRPVLEDD